MKNVYLALLALSISLFTNVDSSQARSKHWTITDRQQALSLKIDQGQKSMELTLKEATKLREKMKKLSDHIEKMKSDNGGKLSYKDQGKVEKELNKISIDIEKSELKKRVEVK